ncbi:MAG: pyrroline-5-carboxylate reductase [Brachymonas denitrificans]|uniref:pyrroline-5-carboxylate reductase n=1 Tax=Brachymonas denitrificans TaxID=28220 RepID=UPI001BCA9FF5|nr:pyrroline-5-carboxylate reductase [Brachymonas denitrificans]
MTTSPIPEHLQIAFIGGGNMASAILGGLVRQGMAPDRIRVVEPFAETRARLQQEFGVQVLEAADASLAEADVVVWAVKPQQFEEATRPVAGHVRQALHLSVAAGIPASALTRWLGTERLVRAMPNTPALVGQGMTGLFAGAGASAQDRAVIDALLAPTGQRMWLEQEALIDSLMAISGSGPAYVFYFIEALVRGGVELGLTAEQSKTLAAQTFAGAAALVQASPDAPEVLRQRVTSKGGTTHEAITTMQQHGVEQAIVAAMHACAARGRELAEQFGG